MRVMTWPLYARSAWSQPTTVVAGTTSEGATLASVRSVGVGSASHCGGGYDRLGSYSGLSSRGRRVPSQKLWWRARNVTALLWPLYAFLALTQPATVVAGTTGVGAALASVPSFGVCSASHFGGGHNR
jgi:hypothetical protein